MRKTVLMLGAALVTGCGLMGEGRVATAQPKKPAAKASAAKKPAQPAPPAKGQVQMAGDNGELGVAYTIGREGPVNFTLRRAEWSVAGLNIGEMTFAPKAGEKLLVLHFSVHNPNKEPLPFNVGVLSFTAVDSANDNQESVQQVGHAENSSQLDIELKPAQKVDGYTAFVVPAGVSVPKLIVTPTSGGAVLRYDLRGKVAPLAAPFADPADAAGATARDEVPGEVGKYFPARELDIKLNSASYALGPFGDLEAEEGKRFLVASVSLRNRSRVPHDYDLSTLTLQLETADGEKSEGLPALFKPARDEAASGQLKPGQEYTGRVFLPLPQDVAAKTLYLSQNESRTYAFDVSGTK